MSNEYFSNSDVWSNPPRPPLPIHSVVREPSETNTNCTDPANKDLIRDIKTDVSYILYTEAAITSLVTKL